MCLAQILALLRLLTLGPTITPWVTRKISLLIALGMIPVCQIELSTGGMRNAEMIRPELQTILRRQSE
jgi:hypothetical protein